MRVHGTIQARPAEVFRIEEAPCLRPAPTTPYDIPLYATAKVHRDHHIEVAKALYSIPGNLIGTRVEVRADRKLVRVYSRGQLVKVHPRQAPGHRVTDPADLPTNGPRTRSGTLTPCAGSPPGTAQPLVAWPTGSSTTRCRGPRCARSTPCSGWSRSGVRTGSRPPAAGPWTPKHQRRPRRPDARARHREQHHPCARGAGRRDDHPSLRPRPRRVRCRTIDRGPREPAMTPAPTVSPELRSPPAPSEARQASSTPSPNDSRSPAPAGSVTASSSNCSSPMKSPAVTPPAPRCEPGPPGSTPP